MIRMQFRFHLLPAHQLEMADGEGTSWKATGNDPQFLLKPVNGCFPEGWTLLRFRMRLQGSDFNAVLYLDRGEGFNERDCFVIPVSRKGTVNHIIRLPNGIKHLRLDPMQSCGDIELSDVIFYEIGWPEKVWRMIKRVAPAVKNKNAAGQKYSWPDVISSLTKAYYEVSYGRIPSASALFSYELWIEQFDTTDEKERIEMGRRVPAMPWKPTFSLIMPVYNTTEEFLRKAIDSVCTQIYPYWELCIADDSSSKPHIRPLLQEYADKDGRIKIIFRTTNGHISAASNSALSLATGEFAAFVDHDDILSEKALYRVAEVLNAHPDADIIYSDEDKVDEYGKRFDPHFKPDWNPELFFSLNYISHFTTVRMKLVKDSGGFREGFEGAQDYDLLLRCLSLTDAHKIRHIQEVLYHWRAVSGSTALRPGEKNYAIDSGVRALADFFSKTDPHVRVEPSAFPTTYRIRHSLPEPAPKVSIIIPTRDNGKILSRCIGSIRERTDYPDYEIIVVDNQSQDAETMKYLEKIQTSGIRVLRFNRPFNFSAINNFAVGSAAGDIICLMNNDIEAIDGAWLREMIYYVVNPEIGVVGAKLLYPDDRVQHAGIILGIGGVAGHAHKRITRDDPGYFCRAVLPQALSAVTAACFLVRKAVYQEVGGMEERLAVAFNDVDFCLKVREAGYRNVWTPYALLYHHESLSRGYEDSPEKQARFRNEISLMEKRWGEKLFCDPCYNQNLTLKREDFSIAAEPRISLPGGTR